MKFYRMLDLVVHYVISPFGELWPRGHHQGHLPTIWLPRIINDTEVDRTLPQSSTHAKWPHQEFSLGDYSPGGLWDVRLRWGAGAKPWYAADKGSGAGSLPEAGAVCRHGLQILTVTHTCMHLSTWRAYAMTTDISHWWWWWWWRWWVCQLSLLFCHRPLIFMLLRIWIRKL